MAEKTLNTRIALKYDSYSKWNKWFTAATEDAPSVELTSAPDFRVDGFNFDNYANKGANLQLKRGEIALCEIPTSSDAATTAPTVLFKVGDGTRRFCELSWASALAADVYGWAKASDVQLVEETVEGSDVKVKKINFVGTNKVITLDYLTQAEVNAILEPITQRIADLEDKFNGDDSVDKQFENLDGRLDAVEAAVGTETVDGKTTVGTRIIAVEAAIDTLNGDDKVEGSVAKALKDAKDYADGLAGNYDKSGAAAAVADDLKDHIEAEGNVHGLTKADIHALIDLGNVENKSVTEIKTELSKDGTVAENKTGFVTGGAVYTAVKAAQEAAEQKVTDLTNEGGAVYTNTQNIAALTGAVGKAVDSTTGKPSGLYALIADGDNALDERLDAVEAFFHTAEGKTLDEALDTLVEIQDYLNGDGSATGGMIDRVATLEGHFEDGGRVAEAEGDIDELEQNMAAAQADLNDLKSIAKSYLAKTGEGENAAVTEDAIRIAIDAAKKAGDDAQDGVDAIKEVLEDTKDSEGKVTSAGLVTRVGAIATTVGDANSGLVADNETNKQNIADLLAAVGDEDGGLVKDVAALQGTVGNADSGLVKDVAALQAIVSAEGGNSNAQLRIDIGELQTKVNDEATGLAKTYEIATDANDKADKNAEDIAAIQQNNVSSDGINLLYKGDIIIFDCGGSGV